MPYEDREASDELYQNRKPAEQRWFRNPKCVQNVRERFGTASQLCVAVFHESVAYHQSQRDGIPSPFKQRG
jgi:hypothetical protein